jgi:quercetin dioxygenase-like cupin family protein
LIQHFFGPGVYAKESRIPAGHVLVQHAHKYDHLSILASGSVEVVVDGKTSVVNAPACFTIEANKHHGVKTLTDAVWYCIHATDCTDENEIDDALVQPANMTEFANVLQTLKKEY